MVNFFQFFLQFPASLADFKKQTIVTKIWSTVLVLILSAMYLKLQLSITLYIFFFRFLKAALS